MKQHCLDNNVTCLSMPRLGCGLDRLNWYKVSSIIYETFRELELTITVTSLHKVYLVCFYVHTFEIKNINVNCLLLNPF